MLTNSRIKNQYLHIVKKQCLHFNLYFSSLIGCVHLSIIPFMQKLDYLSCCLMPGLDGFLENTNQCTKLTYSYRTRMLTLILYGWTLLLFYEKPLSLPWGPNWTLCAAWAPWFHVVFCGLFSLCANNCTGSETNLMN